MEDISWAIILVSLIGSFVAGAINTLAGNGSVITLSILTDLIHLDGGVANGTNRVGVFLQSLASTKGFANNGLFDFKQSTPIILWTCIGAFFGVLTAVTISNEHFLFVFRYLMVLMLIITIFKPERWLHTKAKSSLLPSWAFPPVFVLFGFFGGFLRLGMGLFFMAFMGLLAGYPLMVSNAIKTTVVTIFTAMALAIFAWKGLVKWEIGFVMAIGQAVGGFVTAHYGSRLQGIEVWAYRLLLLIIILSVMSHFGTFDFIESLFKD